MIATPETLVFVSVSSTPGRFGATVYGELFERRGIDAVYLPRPAPPDARGVVDAIRALGLAGASVSSPHKQAVMPHLDEIAPAATAAGAVNTIVHLPRPAGDAGDAPSGAGRLVGHCTDVDGVRGCLEGVACTRTVIHGAGGVVGPAVAALRDLGAEDIVIVARRPRQAQAVAARLGVRVLDDTEDVDDAANGVDLVVNATPAGRPEPDGTLPALPAVLAGLLARTRAVLDMPVVRGDTAVVRTARERGLVVRTGVDMCVHQVARQAALYLERADVATDVGVDEIRAIVTRSFLSGR